MKFGRPPAGAEATPLYGVANNTAKQCTHRTYTLAQNKMILSLYALN